jgi:hypothetical protein
MPTSLQYNTAHIENNMSNNSTVACIRCCRNIFTEPMPSNNSGIHMQTYRLGGGFMEHVTEMGTGAMIYIPSFIKTGLDIQKLMEGEGGFTDIQKAW